ncbi:uncharacterized protein MYCFIDRAFT_77225 [Pseudocercospora fijiensis CIRAD86]|uniref:Uncharacterized protein n=1 Tax=Pseudocercospora fijiensis (strain CIRAD86) TaxID=383855 RepID=M3A7B6_PSEFD|nr:uncharacterized protein MYCFIDRAFT_77225 [Pseudocercospora fijiensis CIRAD86]EME86984.1 hypothetical protein MYCFIDRAFT_77225 [Pseudocercospora fijiensis CIRAD86]
MTSPIKTYEIINQNTFRAKHFEVRQNGIPILWINTQSHFLEPPQINIQTQSSNGPILAAAKLRAMKSGCRVIVGNPDATSKEQWNDVAKENFRGNCYGFSCGGRRFLWKRTHQKALGASTWGSTDFKLIDSTSPETILAVSIKPICWSLESRSLKFYTELGQELELMAMAAIMGIEEKNRRNKNAAAASGKTHFRELRVSMGIEFTNVPDGTTETDEDIDSDSHGRGLEVRASSEKVLKVAKITWWLLRT